MRDFNHNSKFIKIGSRLVGEDYTPLVIVEIGINHGGSLNVAFEMVDAAHSSGAEIIKHQTHVVEDEMSRESKKIKPGNADVSIFSIDIGGFGVKFINFLIIN